MPFKPMRRVDLRDEEGNTLSVILESNHVSWKLFCIYKRPDQTDKQGDHSSWWTFVNEERAIEHHDEKIAEAISQGWNSPT